MGALAIRSLAVFDLPPHFSPRSQGATHDDTVPASLVTNAEQALIRRVIHGDHDAFVTLVRPYERLIFLSAMSILGNDADAEEVAQEAVLKAFSALPRFRQECKFSTWMTQIVMNEAKMRLRKDRRHLYESIEAGSAGEDGSYLPRDFADHRETPSEALEHRELREMLGQALTILSPKYRPVLLLRDVEQLSIAETAEILGLSQGNVKTRLSRARLQLRDYLAPRVKDVWNRERTPASVRTV